MKSYSLRRAARHPGRARQVMAICSALDGMASALEELGDDLANRKPAVPDANSPYVILTHCLGVIEFWIGHLLLGRPSSRDTAAEFTASGPIEPLLARVKASKESVRVDFDRPFPATVTHPEKGDRASSAAMVQHVMEELFQHLGHMKITRDLLVANDMQPRPDQRQRLSRTPVFPLNVDAPLPGFLSREGASVEAARRLLEGDRLRLDELWLRFWAEGGDANILELDAYIHREIRLSEADTHRFHAVIHKIVLDRPEPRVFP